jgi:hypothetical protein
VRAPAILIVATTTPLRNIFLKQIVAASTKGEKSGCHVDKADGYGVGVELDSPPQILPGVQYIVNADF